MAVGTGVTAVPLPAPTALMPTGTLETPGAAGEVVTLFTPEVAAPVVLAPVVVVPVEGGALLTFCAITNVLANARPAIIKVVRRPILEPL